MVGDVLLMILAVLTILAAGMSVFCAIVQSPSRYARWERIAYCYPLGMTALGVPMLLLSWGGIHANVILIGALVVAGCLVVRALRREAWRGFWSTSTERAGARTPLTEFEWFLLFVIVACLTARTVACLLAPLNDTDGLGQWGPKAQVLYHETLKTTDFFQNPDNAGANQKYPLLVPFMYAWVCTVLGRWDDLRMLILNPLNLIVFTTLLYFTVRRYGQRTVALAVTAIAASVPLVMHYTECAQADIPLMLLTGTSLFCLLDWMRERRTDSLLLAGVLMGGAFFTKRETPMIFAAHVCAAVLSAIISPGSLRFKQLAGRLALYGAIAGAVALPWFLFQRNLRDLSWYSSNISFATIRWHDVPGMILYVLNDWIRFYNSVRLPKWSLFWPVLVLSIVLSRSIRQHPWSCLLVAYLVHLTGVLLTYAAGGEPLTLGTGTEYGWERETIVMLPALLLLLGKCADEQWRIWKDQSTIR